MQLESSRTKAGNKSNVRGICENTKKRERGTPERGTMSEREREGERGERNKITIA